MTVTFSNLDDFAADRFDTIIDVRAPSEFAEDHVPGAINLPVLDDEERARVGTIYTRQSPFLARKIGAALVARNAASHIEGALAGHDGGWRPLVYCWRGGQRSNSFASILTQIGWRVAVVDGGYRTYRRLVRDTLYESPFPARVILLDGYTGSAKTEILHRIAARGGQIADLEGLANHRGSVFGAMGEQPSQKGFESHLAQVTTRLDPDRPVLVEAESSKVGRMIVPPALWSAMQSAPRIRIEAPRPARARYLTRAYADIVADPERLDRVLLSLVPLQGHDRIGTWRDLAKRGETERLALELMEHHYDPRYARKDREADRIVETQNLDTEGLDRVADRIMAELSTI
ncbi:tRNA 2-selenouridine(34) synthase MnmH [Palleronia sp. LCG004]|uniref:tRNA 2-selenouridine(34) synthase MnmH n=1 Tax=Palleronia sp. LCG004 TaxID=3079304 RepID=UPI0029421C34|nr:tRNA 2-selenouridine(34) synthase MnmH [Palleronia sp. LCG004]WOI55048.1 tRNA 2-selenouridine(34) synthase MnmH [Palleronia sp. LCG004]